MINVRVVPNNIPMLHVRFEGRSYDIPLNELVLDAAASDEAVRTALAQHFDVAVVKFAAYVVERHANGNLTVRPEAVFG
jgi:hypothetical protein